MTSFRGKILVIRGGAIGDFILTLPAISALRRNFPEAYLEVLGYPHIVQLAIAGGLVDKTRHIEARALAGFFARGGELAEDLVDYFSEFDLIISYLYDPDKIFQTNVGRCSPAQFLVGPFRAEDDGGVHATQVFLKPLERLAIFEADPVPQLRLENARIDEPGGEVGGNTLALHPGSGSEKKNWPADRWAELLTDLVNMTSFNLLLVGGEAEGERLQWLGAALPPARTQVAQNLPLTQLGGMLSHCCGFVGPDSGISHLAAAVGLPGLILWGDRAEKVWRPPSRMVVVLKYPSGLQQLPVSRVLEQVRQIFEPQFTVS